MLFNVVVVAADVVVVVVVVVVVAVVVVAVAALLLVVCLPFWCMGLGSCARRPMTRPLVSASTRCWKTRRSGAAAVRSVVVVVAVVAVCLFLGVGLGYSPCCFLCFALHLILSVLCRFPFLALGSEGSPILGATFNLAVGFLGRGPGTGGRTSPPHRAHGAFPLTTPPTSGRAAGF